MSLFILDTDTLSLWQRRHPKGDAEIARHPPADVAVTIISVEEQFNGRFRMVRRLTQPDQKARAYLNLTKTVEFFSRVQILTFTELAILRFEHLKRLKLKIGGMDLRIAAIALEAGATVVTRNRADFGRVPGLAVADWSA